MTKGLIGETLAEARQRLGKSIKEVEFDTKIRTRFIEALERDDFDTLPADIYTQGFLKTYAVYLGLDPEPLLQQYKSVYMQPNYSDLAHVSSNMRVETKKHPVWVKPLIAVGALAALFVILLIWGALAQNMTKDEPKVRVETINPRKTVPTAVASASTSTTEKRVSATAKASESSDSSNNSETSDNSNDSDTSDSATSDQEPRISVKLTGIEGEGSWVRVTVDGERKYTGVLPDGGSKLFEAVNSVTVRIGNAKGLEVMVDGKKVSTKKFKAVNGIIVATFKAGEKSSGQR